MTTPIFDNKVHRPQVYQSGADVRETLRRHGFIPPTELHRLNAEADKIFTILKGNKE